MNRSTSLSPLLATRETLRHENLFFYLTQFSFGPWMILLLWQVFWEPSISYITPCCNRSYAGSDTNFTGSSHNYILKTSPVGVGKSTVTFSSSIIGIFQLKFYTVEENGRRAYIQLEEDVEIVIGRDKVKAELRS